jgi:CRISPR-associated protein Cas1
VSNLLTHERSYYSPARPLPFDTIVLEGDRGVVTLDALKWLGLRGVSIVHLDFNGDPLNVVLPNRGPNGHAESRVAQVRAYLDPDRRLEVAVDLVRAKVERLVEQGYLSDWAAVEPPRLASINHAMLWEARVTEAYWQRLGLVRDYPGAHDAANALVNYTHALLCSRVLVEAHRQGLDPDVGFLHEVSPYRRSLVYDLAEPWYATADEVALRVNRELQRSAFRRRSDGRVILRDAAVRESVRSFAERWTVEEPSFRRATEGFARDLTLGRTGDYRRALRVRPARGATARPIRSR